MWRRMPQPCLTYTFASCSLPLFLAKRREIYGGCLQTINMKGKCPHLGPCRPWQAPNSKGYQNGAGYTGLTHNCTSFVFRIFESAVVNLNFVICKHITKPLLFSIQWWKTSEHGRVTKNERNFAKWLAPSFLSQTVKMRRHCSGNYIRTSNRSARFPLVSSFPLEINLNSAD